jgi:DNA-binding MarR family transcriptional regulator
MFEHCLYFNTTSLARQLDREWTRAFKPFGLTPSQAFMLRVILDMSPITHTDLASVLNITKATCSRTVDGLVQLGFIKREQADADGRTFELIPLRSASAIKTELNQASGEVTKHIKKIIGNNEFETIVTSLRGIGSAIR